MTYIRQQLAIEFPVFATRNHHVIHH
jgi:hypothetical protein